MEEPAKENKWRQIERSLIYFLLTVSGLDLSQEATRLVLIPDTTATGAFLRRQKARLEEKPRGILFL